MHILYYIKRYALFKKKSIKKSISFFKFRKKKILLLGNDRLKYDFKYMFSTANIKGEILYNNDNIDYSDDKKVIFKLNELNEKILKKYYIVVCERKNEQIYKILADNNVSNNYTFIEDLAFYLNDDRDYFGEIFLKRVLDHFHKPHFEYYTSNGELFKKMIYTDSIEGKFCLEPFIYSNVQPYGYVYSCCPSYGYNKIGNILFKSPKKVWNSNAAKLQRLAILNKSFAFCNDNNLCPFMTNEKKSPLSKNRFKEFNIAKSPEKLYIAIDESCNLKCKSCRNSFYNAKGWDLKLRMHLANKLIRSNWCNNAKKLVIAGQGEVFFSKVYEKMVFHSKIRKRKEIEFLTNGTLLNKEKLDKVCNIYDNINICITIDAATKETYSKLRIGGNFDKLCKNLEYIGKMRKNGKVKRVEYLFVVQKDNYLEMPDYIELAKKYNADDVSFSQISDWGTYSKEEFKNISMIDKDGKPKPELKKVLENKAFRKANISKFSNILKFIEK